MADEDEPDRPTKPGRWVKREGRWVRVEEEGRARAFDQGTRLYELPSGDVVREPMSEEELGPVPGEGGEAAEAEAGGGRFGGLFGRGGGEAGPEGEGEAGAEGEGPDGPRRRRGVLVAAVVAILILLVVGLVAAAVLDVADPLGLRGVLGTGDGGDGMNGDGPPPPPPEPDLFRYPVDWTTTNESDSFSGNAELNGPAGQDIPVANANITVVRVVLTWDDSGDDTGVSGTVVANDPDTFRLTVTPPDGEAESVEGANGDDGQGRLELNFTLASVPTVSSVTAETLDNATLALLQQAPVSTAGVGDWNVTVEFVGGGGTCQTNQDGDPIGPDCDNDFSVEFSWTWYEHAFGTPVKVEDGGGGS